MTKSEPDDGLAHLEAVTTAIDGPPDLVAFAGGEGHLFVRGDAGLAGRGCAARLAVPPGVDGVQAAQLALASIRVTGPDDKGRGRPAGRGPVAFGAWPFDPTAPRELIIPAEVVGIDDDGAAWRTTIGGGDGPPADDTASDAPTQYTVRTRQPAAAWCDAVAAATHHISTTEMDKVVLARAVDIEADAPLDTAAVVARLRSAFPECMVALVDGFVCASPETLVERRGDRVRSHPLAGSAPRGGDPSEDARLAASLLASDKDRDEHRLTIDMVHDTLLEWCSYIDEEPEPSVVAVANVQHLGTLVQGRLPEPAPSVLELVHALHPTPAVGGVPTEAALRLQAELESDARGRYAGPVGWVDAGGNGTWAVGIRSAELDGRSARLWAGNGIVVDSDPTTELAETQAKMQAMLGAIVRP